MDLEAKKGDKVVFLWPLNGMMYDKESGLEHLKVGETYTVDRLEVEAFSSDVYLQEVPGKYFNTVMFQMADDLPPLHEIVEWMGRAVEWPKDKAQREVQKAAFRWLESRVRALEEVQSHG